MKSYLDDVPRNLKISLPLGKSAFLWGPRKIGKTTLLKNQFPKSHRYDLLESDTFFRLSKEPFRFREEILALPEAAKKMPIVVDEVQKIPALLDEIHALIEREKLSFILCGSSARKLKMSHANMLGGRAWRFQLFPLTTQELKGRFDLLRALNQGLVPSHYLAEEHFRRDLKAYIQDYLREEIQYEGLVRNLPVFARFLDTIPFSNGEMVNYANIARECGIDNKTVVEYYNILVDTMIGSFLEPFRKTRNRQIITATPKFYLFDVGIAGELIKRHLEICKGAEFGKAFEHFLFMELTAYRGYSEQDFPIRYWRTKTGLEVDFVLGDTQIAIEVKGQERVSSTDLKGIAAFTEDYRPKRSLVVCQEPAPRKIDGGIEILPWRVFLEQLWGGEIL